MIRKLLFASAFTLLALPAFAAGVTVSMGLPGHVFTTTITAANVARYQAWANAAYPTIPNPAYDSTCNPVPGPCAPATLPNPDPIISVFAAMWAGTVANVQSFEKQTAVQAIPAPLPVN